MEHRQLIIENENIVQINYLIKLLSTDARISFDIEKSFKYTIIDVDLPPSYVTTFNKFVAKAIILTEKFTFLSNLLDMEELDYARVTFFSTLLYFDIAHEINIIASGIACDKTISLSGVFNFKFSVIKDEWAELVELIATILNSPHEDEDIFSISAFMLSSRSSADKTVFIAEYPEILLTNVTDGVVCDTISIYEESKFNLIDALIGECPSEVVLEKGSIPEELFNVISKIMQIKLL